MAAFSQAETTEILKNNPGIDSRRFVRRLFAPILGGSASPEMRQGLEVMLNDSDSFMHRLEYWGLARREELEDGTTGWFANTE